MRTYRRFYRIKLNKRLATCDAPTDRDVAIAVDGYIVGIVEGDSLGVSEGEEVVGIAVGLAVWLPVGAPEEGAAVGATVEVYVFRIEGKQVGRVVDLREGEVEGV